MVKPKTGGLEIDMIIFKCVLKTRREMEKEIPRDQWGWWKDACPGQHLLLRRATKEDLARCVLMEHHSRNSDDYMCELSPSGSLVHKVAIKHIVTME